MLRKCLGWSRRRGSHSKPIVLKKFSPAHLPSDLSSGTRSKTNDALSQMMPFDGADDLGAITQSGDGSCSSTKLKGGYDFIGGIRKWGTRHQSAVSDLVPADSEVHGLVIQSIGWCFGCGRK